MLKRRFNNVVSRVVYFGFFLLLILIVGTILNSVTIVQPSGREENKVNYLSQRVMVDLQNLEQDEAASSSCPRFSQLASAIKKCIINGLAAEKPQDIWANISMIAERCGAFLLKNVLRAKYVINRDDIKLVIAPENEDAPCNSVTLGIGNDTRAEQKLKFYVPNVKFYGADPIKESGQVFKDIGDYHAIAVGAEDGAVNASVMIEGKYLWRTVEAVKLDKFVTQLLKLPHIDYLFMDVEGAEYRMFSQLQSDGALSEMGVPICQINMEIHGPPSAYGFDQHYFARVVKSFLRNSNYVPLWIPRPLFHHRMFLVDWKSPYCLQKFFQYWC